ncbi:MAG: AEC family transporter, partial [Clostridiales bacterium]|nr:AEC family transporter [Clostridiales bacterium]
MEPFFLAFNAITPIVIMMLLGYACRRCRIISATGISEMNKLAFNLLLPILLFVNAYSMDLSILNKETIFLSMLAVLSLCIILCLLFLFIPKYSPEKRGSLIQGFFRSNCAIIALPIYTSIYGSDDLGIITILLAAIVPTLTVLSVISLESCKGGKKGLKFLIMQVLKNPL